MVEFVTSHQAGIGLVRVLGWVWFSVGFTFFSILTWQCWETFHQVGSGLVRKTSHQVRYGLVGIFPIGWVWIWLENFPLGWVLFHLRFGFG
jgi:hypothetical protein